MTQITFLVKATFKQSLPAKYRKKSERNEWWTDHCKKIMDEKNEVRKKYLLKKMKVENLNTAKDREAWKRIIEKAKKLEFEVVVP